MYLKEAHRKLKICLFRTCNVGGNVTRNFTFILQEYLQITFYENLEHLQKRTYHMSSKKFDILSQHSSFLL